MDIENSIIVESSKLSWNKNNFELKEIDVKINDYISIIDAALISSGLEDEWLKSEEFEGVWLRKKGRRPLFLHSNQIKKNNKGKNLIFETGIVRSIIEHKIDEGVEPLIEIGNKLGFKKLTLRMKISPELQPIFQSELDKKLVDLGDIGFVIKLPKNMLAICTKI